jgi:fatty-acyl-CoA synthase
MVMGNLACVSHGSSMILPSEGFNAPHSLEAITRYKCTSLYGVPTMFIEYLKEYENNKNKYNIQHLRTGIMAGTLCPQVYNSKK